MGKIQSAGRGPVRPLPLAKLTHAGFILCDVYSELASPDRQKVEDLLLQHAFLPTGTDSYLWCEKWNRVNRISFLRLWDVSHELAFAWLIWSGQISKKRPSRLACRQAILGLVGHLVHRRSFEGPAPCVRTQLDTRDDYKIPPMDASKAVDGGKRPGNIETKTTV
jgi:hypothetical protein